MRNASETLTFILCFYCSIHYHIFLPKFDLPQRCKRCRYLFEAGLKDLIKKRVFEHVSMGDEHVLDLTVFFFFVFYYYR